MVDRLGDPSDPPGPQARPTGSRGAGPECVPSGTRRPGDASATETFLVREPGWWGRKVGVPVRRGRTPALRILRHASELGATLVEAVKRAVVHPHVARDRTDTPACESTPVDLARKPFERHPSLGAEDPPRIVPHRHSAVEVELFPPNPLRRLT